MTYVTFKRTIHLQYIGRVPANEAKNAKIGDKIMFNGGSTCLISNIVKETEKMITFALIHDGVVYNQVFKKDRLIALIAA